MKTLINPKWFKVEIKARKDKRNGRYVTDTLFTSGHALEETKERMIKSLGLGWFITSVFEVSYESVVAEVSA